MAVAFVMSGKWYDISPCFSKFDLPRWPRWCMTLNAGLGREHPSADQILMEIQEKKSFYCTKTSASGQSAWFKIAGVPVAVHRRYLAVSAEQPEVEKPKFWTVTLTVGVPIIRFGTKAEAEEKAIQHAKNILKGEVLGTMKVEECKLKS